MGIVKKLDVLLMLLSGLFPIAGLTKQIPLEQSIYIGGLLFLLVSVVILLKRCIHVYAVG